MFIAGWIFPDVWWGTHFISFHSKTEQFFFGIILFLIFYVKWNFSDQFSTKYNALPEWLVPFLITMILMVIMWQFPMTQDIYGDSFRFNHKLDQIEYTTNDKATNDMLSFGLSPWSGEFTILGSMYYLSYWFEVTWGFLFQCIGVVFGGLFFWRYCVFVSRNIQGFTNRVLLIISGICAPFTLLFYGHIEVYAPMYFFQLMWAIQQYNYIQNPTRKSLLWLVLIYLINIKMHTISLLFTPAMIISILNYFYADKGWFDKIANWHGALKFIFIPVSLVGLFLYFFIFQDHIDNRDFSGVAMEFDHLFLPLFSPEAPLDKYNILSWNHIFDYFNLLLFCAPVTFFTIVSIVSSHKKSLQNDLAVLLLSVTIILFLGLFFVINPLLSMQMDWDLMSMFAPALLVLNVALWHKCKWKVVPNIILRTTLVICLFSIVTIITHLSFEKHTMRLESVIYRNFQTYYEWTARNLKSILEADGISIPEQISRRENMLDRLRAYSTIGNDEQYARLLRDQGHTYYKELQQPELAIPYFEKAYVYKPTLMNNIQFLAESYFFINEFNRSHQWCEILVKNKFPNESDALRMATHSALEAGLYSAATQHVTSFLKLQPTDSMFSEIHYRLNNNISVHQLKQFFSSDPTVR